MPILIGATCNAPATGVGFGEETSALDMPVQCGSTGATTANCTGGNLICPGRGGGTGTPEGKGDTAPLTEVMLVTKKLALQKG